MARSGLVVETAQPVDLHRGERDTDQVPEHSQQQVKATEYQHDTGRDFSIFHFARRQSDAVA